MHPRKILPCLLPFWIAMNESDHCLILGFATGYSTSVRKFTVACVGPTLCISNQQVPPLRIALGGTNRNAPVGMTDF
jgi:hypothetical protein